MRCDLRGAIGWLLVALCLRAVYSPDGNPHEWLELQKLVPKKVQLSAKKGFLPANISWVHSSNSQFDWLSLHAVAWSVTHRYTLTPPEPAAWTNENAAAYVPRASNPLLADCSQAANHTIVLLQVVTLDLYWAAAAHECRVGSCQPTPQRLNRGRACRQEGSGYGTAPPRIHSRRLQAEPHREARSREG
jgi:hypothetical protein